MNHNQTKLSHRQFNNAVFAYRFLSTSLLSLLFLSSFVLAGYKSLKVKLEPAKTYSFHQQQGAVTIAADPYETKEKIKTAFDLKELEQMSIVPVHVVVSNDGEDTIAISGQDINLLDSNNRSFEPLPVDEVVRAIVYKEGPRASRSPSPIPLPRGGGRRGDAFEIETDLTNKSLRDLRVAPRTTSGGFVFFKLPNNRMRLSGYKVYIPEIRNLKTRQSLLFFEIELK
ncbi:MAG: hypothetical protein L0387_01880 [Acidobacteria bacterium]|nr:hypothetical protein [Acidobacteriota bacterium]MCI0719209.1 hypothetical protein [Acidobacteriota bacterium]